MTKLKKFSICLASGIAILGTVSFARTGTVNAPNGLVLRETASKGANPITTVGDNQKVEIIEENGEWYKVKYGNYEGYMFAEYVEAEAVVEEKPQEQEKPSEEVKAEEVKAEEIEDKNEKPEEQEKTYPKEVTLKANLKVYLIPSITSKVILDAEVNAKVTINYELNEWFNVTYNNTQGWVRKYYINNIETPVNTERPSTEDTNKEIIAPEENKKEEEKQTNTTIIENKKGYINVSTSANIREKANTSSAIINTLTRNTGVTIVGEEGEFYKIQYQDITGYISKVLISDKPVETTSRGNINRLEKENIVNIEENVSEQKSTEGQKIVDYAKKYLGYNYVSGGTTPSNRI